MFIIVAYLFGLYSGWMLRKNQDTFLKLLVVGQTC